MKVLALGLRPERETPDATWLQVIQQQAASLHYGGVQITIHGSKVVQIEKTEKIRVSPQR